MKNMDLTGKKFGHLTVESLHYSGGRGASWNCVCECGEKIVLYTSHLLGTKNRNPNKSCGCLNKVQDGNTIKHKRIYGIYKCMMNRCNNSKVDNYERYGGKGVTVCEEWQVAFNPFLIWALANGYEKDLTIDRKDFTKPYSPQNCRWADYYTQEANKCISKNNNTGCKGVTYSEKQRYRAYITRNDIRKNLGSFDTLEEAVKARKDIEEKYIRTGTL